MRLIIIALTMLPFASHAQEAAPAQSCPVGMVWDGAANNCAVAANTTSPLEGLPTHTGCKGDAARQVTS